MAAAAVRKTGSIFLEESIVKEKTTAKYRKELSAFTTSCTVPLKIDPAIDAELVSYMQKLYEEGHQPSRGECLLAGVLFLWPAFGKLGTRTLPRAWKALRGWRRRCPARSRCPHSLPIWAGIAVQLWREGLYGFAIYLMMMVATYTRPSELLSVQRRDLQKPLTNVSLHWQLLLFPEERPERSKVYAANDSIELQAEWAPWLPAVASTLAKGGQKERIFPFSYGEFCSAFRKAVESLQLPTMVPYQARHSGPSIDAARNLRDRASIKARGRWTADKSVLRYEQRARLVASFNKLPHSLQDYSKECEQKLPDLFLGKLLVDAQPLPPTRG